MKLSEDLLKLLRFFFVSSYLSFQSQTSEIVQINNFTTMDMIKLNGCFLSGCEYTSHHINFMCWCVYGRNLRNLFSSQKHCGTLSAELFTVLVLNFPPSSSSASLYSALWCDTNGFCVKGIILKYSINFEEILWWFSLFHRSCCSSDEDSSLETLNFVMWWEQKNKLLQERTKSKKEMELSVSLLRHPTVQCFWTFSVERFHAFDSWSKPMKRSRASVT